jgi:hypothetical protein
MFAGGSHRRLEVGLRGGDTDDGFGHGTQVADVFGRRRVGIELIEPCLGLGGGLLKLLTGTRHGHHPPEIAIELLASWPPRTAFDRSQHTRPECLRSQPEVPTEVGSGPRS